LKDVAAHDFLHLFEDLGAGVGGVSGKVDVADAEAPGVDGEGVNLVDGRAKNAHEYEGGECGAQARGGFARERAAADGNALAGAAELRLLVVFVVIGEGIAGTQRVVRKRIAARRRSAVEGIVGGWVLIARHKDKRRASCAL